MRHRESNRELTVQAIAGTHCVLLGIDLEDPAGCLGFAIHRTDHTEAEAYWLRGLKVFPSIVPNPAAGTGTASLGVVGRLCQSWKMLPMMVMSLLGSQVSRCRFNTARSPSRTFQSIS